MGGGHHLSAKRVPHRTVKWKKGAHESFISIIMGPSSHFTVLESAMVGPFLELPWKREKKFSRNHTKIRL